MSQQIQNTENTLTAMTFEENPRIYVASLSDYNSGILHGKWLDATQSYEEIMDEIQAMLEESPTAKKYGEVAEEYAIHDYENFFGMSLNEYETIETVCLLAEALQEHGEAFALYYENGGCNDIEEAKDSFMDAFCGEYNSEEDYAAELANELMPADAPSFLTQYFDYEAFSRDLFISDNYSCSMGNGNVAIFRYV